MNKIIILLPMNSLHQLKGILIILKKRFGSSIPELSLYIDKQGTPPSIFPQNKFHRKTNKKPLFQVF